MTLLDTHAWIWFLADSSRLSREAEAAIARETEDSSLLLSSISVWELFMLVKKGRLELSVEPAAFLTITHRDPRFSIVPVDEVIARRSVELPDIHGDPADRMILATAVELGVPVVSRDSRLAEYGAARVIW